MDDREVSKLFGERLRRKRMMFGVNQRTFADQLGMPVAHLSRLELGGNLTISLGELRRFVEALKTSADYLLGLSDDPGEIPEKEDCLAVV
jgi:transcriptional regulator with XRE-family HTH domain